MRSIRIIRPSGAGTGVKEGAKVSTGDKLTVENVTELRGQELIDNMGEAFAIANEAAKA